jgi:LacI family transcriptional regulator
MSGVLQRWLVLERGHMGQKGSEPRHTEHADGTSRRKPSSWDIAREANVSQSTVSRVINNSPRISKATRVRVKKAMERLGYSPNAAARTLITGRSNLIGLVVSNITNPFYPEVIEAIVATATEHDYNVILCNTQENLELQTAYLELLIEHQVDGAILTSSLLDYEGVMGQIGLDRIPVVMVNRTVEGLRVDSVRLDNTGAGRIVAGHLTDLGHRSIGFVGGLEATSTNSARLAGFRSTLVDLGIDLPAEYVVHGEFTRASGYSLTQQLLALPDRPTALFCADDQIAFGAIDAVLDAGLDVPDDVAVIGVDDVPAASLRQVALTTVRQPAGEMGRRAVQLLLERMRGRPDDERIEIVLRPRLVIRRTCGASRSAPVENSSSRPIPVDD